MKKLVLILLFLYSYAFAYEGSIKIEYDLDGKNIMSETFFAYDEQDNDTFTGVLLKYSAEISAEIKSVARELAVDLARECADSAIPCNINLEVVVENGSPKLISK